MAEEDVSLHILTKRAAVRALPAKKFLASAQSWCSKRELDEDQTQNAIADALLSCLATEYPISSLYGYVNLAVSTSTITARALAIQLLWYMYDNRDLSQSTIVSIAGSVIGNGSGLELESPLPSTLERPTTIVPDVGTSENTRRSPEHSEAVPTLTLIIPLLRQCTVTSGINPPIPILALANRLVTLVKSYPAPPLDVGLEAGSLLQLLPECLMIPLRSCLSGLMADLSAPEQMQSLHLGGNDPSGADLTGNTSNGTFSGPMVGAQGNALVVLPSGPLPVPLQKTLNLLLVNAIRSSRFTPTSNYTNSTPTPPDNFLNLVRMGTPLSQKPATYLTELVRAVVVLAVRKENFGTSDGIQHWLVLVEQLPSLLRWWKDQSMSEWSYPGDLVSCLAAVFEQEAQAIDSLNAWVSEAMKTYTSSMDVDDDNGAFVHPEGWMLCSLQVTIVQKLLHYGLLDNQDAGKILPNVSLPSDTPGESLLQRLISAPRSHLKTLAHLAAFAPGAARSLTVEILDSISSSASSPAPDNLFVNIATEPAFLALMSGIVNSPTILDLCLKHLIDTPDDPSSRNDDPQGALTRFGEGVMLVEALVAECKLPKPKLLRDARRANGLVNIEDAHKTCINGWVKALFGPDGIDDEILLATSPQDFYRLAPSLILQAVTATASGQIDMDTLHSGLSYFSQPLLSWSLAGIVSWLCDDSIRNGYLSAFHLNVLQNLVLSQNFPPALFRVTGSRIARLLLPNTGLMPVFQISGFDVINIQQKLDSLNIITDPNESSNALMAFSNQLQSLRALDLVADTWPTSLCHEMERAIQSHGPNAVARLILEQVLQPTQADFSGAPGDSFPSMVSLLLNLRYTYQPPLLSTFIQSVLPSLFDADSRTINPSAPLQALLIGTNSLAQTLKFGLMVMSAIRPRSEVEGIANRLVNDLVYQRGRPTKDAQATASHTPKKRKRGEERELTVYQKAVLEALVASLGGDEELRNKWNKFGELVDNPST